MTSFTLRSKDFRFIALITGLVLSMVASVIYTLDYNPEIKFWKAALNSKRAWSDKIHSAPGRVNVFSGGSTTAFQIDDAILTREFSIPSVNAGLNAGLGLDGTVAQATTFLKKGDRLVLMTEPEMLAGGGGEITALNNQLTVATGLKEGFTQRDSDGHSRLKALSSCRPGLYHVATMIGKIVSRRPSYRYQLEDIQEGGFVVTPVRNDMSHEGLSVQRHTLTPRAKNFLSELREWAAQRGIEVIYLFPVSYIKPELLDEQRQANEVYLKEIETIIPVCRDSFLGASADADDFADTALHMTQKAAQNRTRVLAGFFPRP